jgi:hypothetical protein
MGPSSAIGAVMPVSLKAPTKVVVFQCPWGIAADLPPKISTDSK